MSKREELQKQNNDLKGALQDQLNNMKGDVQKVGKSALLIGGSLLATYLLVDALTAKRKKKKKSKDKGNVQEEVVKKPAKDNLLLSTAKEQAVIFLLGLAAQQLATFLSELDSKDDKENS
ncbi:MAG: hypothetical protein HEP71_17995 [Roseivirga sp.]|nr:hypothetical protein [Roseivirga sp.]